MKIIIFSTIFLYIEMHLSVTLVSFHQAEDLMEMAVKMLIDNYLVARKWQLWKSC